MAYNGPIEPGMGFLWEPKKAHAREALVVSQFMRGGADGSPEGRVQTVTQARIGSAGEADRSGSRAIVQSHEFVGTWNDESRFREAVVRCIALDEGEFTELPGRYHLRATVDAITDAALPVAPIWKEGEENAATRARHRAQVEIADAVVALLDTRAQNGYTDAFYAVANMLGVPAMPISPRDAWENEVEPRLRRILDKARAPRSAEADLEQFGVSFKVDGEVVHPSRVSVVRKAGTDVGREA